MKSIINCLSIVLVSLWMIACEDDFMGGSSDGGTTNKKELTVPFSLPIFDIPSTESTRKLNDSTECEVKSVDVFVFKKQNNTCIAHHLVERFYHYDGDGYTKKHFRIPCMPDEEVYYLLLVANAKTTVIDVSNNTDGYWIDKSYTDISTNLNMAFTPKAWEDIRTDVTGIPMWGESASFRSELADTIHLHRALVRTDIKLDLDATTTTTYKDFKIDSVYVYNANDTLALVPDKSTLENKGGKPTPTSPTIPSMAKPLKDVLGCKNEVAVINKDTIIQDIYFPESTAGSLNTIHTHTFLVIKASYKNDKGQRISRFYRIDYAKPVYNSDKTLIVDTEFVPLVRNHKYKITIKQVLGEGFEKRETAAKTIGNNNNIVIDLVCEDDKYSNIFYDGYNYVKLDRKCIYRDYHEGHEVTFDVLTNTGATIECEKEWLEIKKIENDLGNKEPVGKKGELLSGLNTVTVEYIDEYEPSESGGVNKARGQYILITPNGSESAVAKIKVLQFSQRLIEFPKKGDNLLNKTYWATRKACGTAFPLGKNGKKIAKDDKGATIDWMASVKTDNSNVIERIMTPSNNPEYITNEGDRKLLKYQHPSEKVIMDTVIENYQATWTDINGVKHKDLTSIKNFSYTNLSNIKVYNSDIYGLEYKVADHISYDRYSSYITDNRDPLWTDDDRLFRFQMHNRWEDNLKDTVIFQFQTIDDPTCIMYDTIEVFGQMKLGGFLITPPGIQRQNRIIEENKKGSLGKVLKTKPTQEEIDTIHKYAYYPRWSFASGVDTARTYVRTDYFNPLIQSLGKLPFLGTPPAATSPLYFFSDGDWYMQNISRKGAQFILSYLYPQWGRERKIPSKPFGETGLWGKPEENRLNSGWDFWGDYLYYGGPSIGYITTKVCNDLKKSVTDGNNLRVMGFDDGWRLPDKVDMKKIWDENTSDEGKMKLANLALHYHYYEERRAAPLAPKNESTDDRSYYYYYTVNDGQLSPSIEPRISWEATGAAYAEVSFLTSSSAVLPDDRYEYYYTLQYIIDGQSIAARKGKDGSDVSNEHRGNQKGGPVKYSVLQDNGETYAYYSQYHLPSTASVLDGPTSHLIHAKRRSYPAFAYFCIHNVTP